MRYSRQREQIYEIVASTRSHPDAEWIYSEARKAIPDISLGTVYRNLGRLCDEGKLLSLETSLGSVHYDATTCDHTHFICSKCGKIIDVGASGFRKRLEEQGFSVSVEKHIFYGVCNDCNEKNKQQKSEDL